jgi:prophage regulatory protein
MVRRVVTKKASIDGQRQSALGDNNVLRRKDLKTATGLSPATVYRMIARGEFPRPVKLGLQAVGWMRADVDAWLNARRDPPWGNHQS